MKTRCKFQVLSVAQTYYGDERVKLDAVYDDTKDPENASFAAATPFGSMEISVSNPIVKGSFKPGAYYYIDLIPCETK